jgi:hypothetical protein
MIAAVAYKTYQMFARKYGIRLSYVKNGTRKPKSFDMFKREIRRHENTYRVRGGLYR